MTYDHQHALECDIHLDVIPRLPPGTTHELVRRDPDGVRLVVEWESREAALAWLEDPAIRRAATALSPIRNRQQNLP